MPVSRRGFLRGSLASRSGAFLAARGLEAYLAEAAQGSGSRGAGLPPGVNEIRISSNENPLGPGKAALDAILGKFPEAGRYPFNSTPNDGSWSRRSPRKHKVKPENIVLGAGSQEILKNAVRAFTTRERGLVTASPSFENCTGDGARGWSIRSSRSRWTRQFRLDLEAMLAARRRAPGSSSSTTRTTRRRRSTARRRSPTSSSACGAARPTRSS